MPVKAKSKFHENDTYCPFPEEGRRCCRNCCGGDDDTCRNLLLILPFGNDDDGDDDATNVKPLPISIYTSQSFG